MRKLLLILFCLLPSSPCWAGGVIMMGGGVPTVSCSETKEGDLNVTTTAIWDRSDLSPARTYLFFNFTSTDTYTAYKLSLVMSRSGSTPSGNLTVAICTTDGDGEPATCTDVVQVAKSTIGGSLATRTWTLSSPYSITNATQYAVRLYGDGTGDSSEYFETGYINTGTHVIKHSPTGLADSWTLIDGDASGSFMISNCVP